MQIIIQFSIVFKFLNTIHSCICKRIYEFWLFRKNRYIFDVGQGGLKGTMTQKPLLHQNIFNYCELLLMGLKRYTGKYINVRIYAKKDPTFFFIFLYFIHVRDSLLEFFCFYENKKAKYIFYVSVLFIKTKLHLCFIKHLLCAIPVPRFSLVLCCGGSKL